MKDLFLCHTGTDKDWVRELGSRLEQERINGRPIEVFFDEWDIDYGGNIISEIDRGLKQSRYVGLVLSPAMINAEWPTAEWQSQVMADPTGKRGKILPILRHPFDPQSGEPLDLPFVLKPLKRFDFTQDKNFDAELQRLIRKLAGLPPQRGGRRGLGAALAAIPAGQEAPDVVEEALPSNLFPVLRLPEWLYSDVTSAKTKREVWDEFRGKHVPPFVLYQERLVSFVPHDAPDSPFATFLMGASPQTERATDWLADPDRGRQVIGMLNSSLREHCYHLGIFTQKKGRPHFYCPIFNSDEPRTFRWGSTGRSRTLAKMKARANGQLFGVHMSAYMRFISVGDRVFLLVEPSWLFTTNGITPLEGKEVGVFSTKWGGRERNASVLRNVLMWGLLLAEGKREIIMNVGTAEAPVDMVLQSVPVHTTAAAGLAGDAIRLDRILGGDGAGEVGRVPAVGGETAAEEDELDVVGELALVGALIPEEAADTERLDEADAVIGEPDEDYDEGDDAPEEFEFPF